LPGPNFGPSAPPSDVRLVSCKLDGANIRFAHTEHVVFDDGPD
jgi:hypothetical protein